MAGPFDNIPINITTGEYLVDGVWMTKADYMSLVDETIQAHVEALSELRDPTTNLQNLWGNKENAFQDNIYNRVPCITRPEGYGQDIDPDDWKPF